MAKQVIISFELSQYIINTLAQFPLANLTVSQNLNLMTAIQDLNTAMNEATKRENDEKQLNDKNVQ